MRQEETAALTIATGVVGSIIGYKVKEKRDKDKNKSGKNDLDHGRTRGRSNRANRYNYDYDDSTSYFDSETDHKQEKSRGNKLKKVAKPGNVVLGLAALGVVGYTLGQRRRNRRAERTRQDEDRLNREWHQQDATLHQQWRDGRPDLTGSLTDDNYNNNNNGNNERAAEKPKRRFTNSSIFEWDRSSPSSPPPNYTTDDGATVLDESIVLCRTRDSKR